VPIPASSPSCGVTWVAPITGTLEPGEEAATGAAREVLEETCVVARVDRLATTS
jgi:ADP-ribose pyrophosphatase YjhB (NUDIX family)